MTRAVGLSATCFVLKRTRPKRKGKKKKYVDPPKR